MKKAINTFIILCGVALCLYVIVLAWGRNSQNGGGRKSLPAQQADQSQVKAAPVKVATVRPQPITEYLLLPATVEAWEDIDLSAKIGGTVEWVGPEEGSRVTSGAAVVRLDIASKQALVNQAQAVLTQGEKQYERVSKLVRDRVSSQSELDNVVAQRDVARANLEVAQVVLTEATLHSPIDGVIDRIRVDVGEHVNAGQVVAKIVQTDRAKIVVNVPEKDVAYCARGQEAGVFLDQVRLDQLVRGQVYYVALTGDPISRTYPIYIEIDNRAGRLRPGMIVRVGLVRRRVEDALTAPLYAVVDRGDRKVVFVAKDGRAVQRQVAPGIIEADRVQVTEGLAAGEQLIVVGQRDLTDGEPIQIEETVQP